MAEPVDGLSGLPLFLQWALGAGAFVASVIAVLFGARAKQAADVPPPTAGPAVQWFLDGPIGKAIRLLEDVYRELQRQREDHQRFANESNRKHDEQTALLRDINKKQDEQIGLLEDVKEKLHDLELRGHSK